MTGISGQTVQDTIEVILESHLLPRQNLDKVSMGENMRSGPTYFAVVMWASNMWSWNLPGAYTRSHPWSLGVSHLFCKTSCCQY